MGSQGSRPIVAARDSRGARFALRAEPGPAAGGPGGGPEGAAVGGAALRGRVSREGLAPPWIAERAILP